MLINGNDITVLANVQLQMWLKTIIILLLISILTIDFVFRTKQTYQS